MAEPAAVPQEKLGQKARITSSILRAYLDWTRERMRRLEPMDFAGKDEALEPVRRAESFWKLKAGAD